MTNIKIMRLNNTELFEDFSYFDSLVEIKGISSSMLHVLKSQKEESQDSDYLLYQLSKIQTNLTRAKKSLREIVKNNNSEKKYE